MNVSAAANAVHARYGYRSAAASGGVTQGPTTRAELKPRSAAPTTDPPSAAGAAPKYPPVTVGAYRAQRFARTANGGYEATKGNDDTVMCWAIAAAVRKYGTALPRSMPTQSDSVPRPRDPVTGY